MKDVSTQGKTLECLAEKIAGLGDQCRKQVLRVAELQADDYHLDHQLYYACREDRENLCAEVPAGGGKIYECLFKHKFDKLMSTKVCIYLECKKPKFHCDISLYEILENM